MPFPIGPCASVVITSTSEIYGKAGEMLTEDARERFARATRLDRHPFVYKLLQTGLVFVAVTFAWV